MLLVPCLPEHGYIFGYTHIFHTCAKNLMATYASSDKCAATTPCTLLLVTKWNWHICRNGCLMALMGDGWMRIWCACVTSSLWARWLRSERDAAAAMGTPPSEWFNGASIRNTIMKHNWGEFGLVERKWRKRGRYTGWIIKRNLELGVMLNGLATIVCENN